MTTASAALPEMLPDALALGPTALFDLLARRLQDRVGYALLTVLATRPDRARLVRLYSSNEEQYPLGDADEVEDSAWFRRLFGDREPVVANDAARIAAWLPGYDAFAGQGYGSLANVPVVVDGAAVGLVNLMSGPGHFTDRRLAALRCELPIAALAILAQARPA